MAVKMSSPVAIFHTSFANIVELMFVNHLRLRPPHFLGMQISFQLFRAQ